ncbi:MAG: VWA domain-containing protein [Winogradskyella sp.]|uniref:VWA domain-containing protein n=1 Tax=Winogradskyella sp. TaxID=1883156 RepID=UPI001831E1CC|nr:VWA domain-containing protein [Winogradskyella sp.]MBT8244763.1 VWA domain-containing protein [Winogradskyella sp.]NNK22889.1 VWA domain-containing protein [Winogradskyella sp.]
MVSITIILIILSGILALLVALFQYVYKSKTSKIRNWLVLLRFLSVFGVLLLIVNPKFEAVSYYEEKPNLIVAIDNSKSINYLGQDQKAKVFFENFISNDLLNAKFNVKAFKFGSDVKTADSLTFIDNQSNFSSFFKRYNELYKNTIAPIVLITDGNQTMGSDYSFNTSRIKQSIYPVILGDTTSYSDLRVGQVNVNRFAYLKNKFPIEIITNYSGEEAVDAVLRIRSGNAILFSKSLKFNSTKTSEIVTVNLNASSVGVKTYSVELAPLANEKNITNNYKNFAVEVIDQKTNIALVAKTIHPDLGALKKAIESNEQRSVSILNPKEFLSQNTDFNLVMLFSPNRNFKSVYDKISSQKLNTFTIAGSSTDWDFVNKNQSFFKQDVTNQSEDYQPSLNLNYGTFIVDNITFDNYPPLKSEFGYTSFLVPEETLLYKSLNGIDTGSSLLSTLEYNGQKHALLNGEGIWKWRAQSYLDTDTFEDFDNVIGKLIQYLSSNKKRRRLNIDFKSFYNQNESIVINAQFFNKNYEFDPNGNLSIFYKNINTNTTSTLPLLLKNASYRIDLSGITPGNYEFTVRSNDEPVSASGKFKILAYDVEKQFLNADVTKLKTIAANTKGKSYFINSAYVLIDDLVSNESYTTIQKSKRSTISLIDYKYLLALIALALSLEWFIRKYNGLI